MKKKIKYCICILIIIFAALIIRSTYSKYQSETKGNIVKDIAQWVLKVNESDIVEGKTFEFNSGFKFVEENVQVKEGAIAPGLSGYFLVAIDTTGTQVSLDQVVTLNQTDLRALSKGGNLKITDVKHVVFESATEDDIRYTKGDSVEGLDLNEDILTFSSTKLINAVPPVMDQIQGFIIEVTWEDSTDPEDMLDDYRIASSGINLSLPISVRVYQHID